eukprot:CAMPEP_0202897660 /NCGR_PEP_ID=MMETSP1392-20130828/6362_1 /ASSEMBLY_ACC=CAM_ASM_000868 /TAXON_ID=225041 /ORGANISM="Chlamydomonas chlamydogama, Strain SAG 11-48b" /LENGTH=39 /DNA_ID= /DNA_START= /DNA_END= /DNA_ORIENTATION=
MSDTGLGMETLHGLPGQGMSAQNAVDPNSQYQVSVSGGP